MCVKCYANLKNVHLSGCKVYKTFYPTLDMVMVMVTIAYKTSLSRGLSLCALFFIHFKT